MWINSGQLAKQGKFKESRHTCWTGWGVGLFLLTFHSGLNAQFQYPIDVAVKGNEILVVDRNLPGLQKIDASGHSSVVYKASRILKTPLNAPRCVAITPEGAVVVGDSSTRQIYAINSGTPKPVLTNRSGIGIPYAMVFDAKGTLYMSDLEAPGRIFKLAPGKTEPELFAKQSAVRGLAIDKSGNLVAITGLKQALIRFTPDGKRTVILDNRPFRFPNGIAIINDDIFVSDSYGKCIWKIGPDQKPIQFCSKGLAYPGGLAVLAGKLVVTDAKSKQVFLVDEKGAAKPVQPE